jgi:transcription termination factor NusB
MGKRREGREAAVQFLYQFEMNRRPVSGLLPDFWKLRSDRGKAEPSSMGWPQIFRKSTP